MGGGLRRGNGWRLTKRQRVGALKEAWSEGHKKRQEVAGIKRSKGMRHKNEARGEVIK